MNAATAARLYAASRLLIAALGDGNHLEAKLRKGWVPLHPDCEARQVLHGMGCHDMRVVDAGGAVVATTENPDEAFAAAMARGQGSSISFKTVAPLGGVR